MRSIVWATLVLLTLGFLASALPLSSPKDAQRAAPPWRRTVDGWQRAYWLEDPAATTSSPPLHPLLFGAFLLTAAVALPITLSKPASPPPDDACLSRLSKSDRS